MRVAQTTIKRYLVQISTVKKNQKQVTYDVTDGQQFPICLFILTKKKPTVTEKGFL